MKRKTFPFLLFAEWILYFRIEHLKFLISVGTNVWKGNKSIICRKSGKHSLFEYKYLSKLLEPSTTVCAVKTKRGPISLWYVVWMFHKHVCLAECFLRNSLEHVCIYMKCVPRMTKSVLSSSKINNPTFAYTTVCYMCIVFLGNFVTYIYHKGYYS